AIRRAMSRCCRCATRCSIVGWTAPSTWSSNRKSAVPKHRSAEGVPIIQGRYRRCGSQQGNALYSITRLGLADKRSDKLAERLMHWQWPDGGWNCDRNPTAHVSSFNESLHPMLGLAAHADRTGDEAARKAALNAAEIFLCRRLYKRR